NKVTVEVGYIGRRIRNEWQQIDLDGIPYNLTLNGQTFANAFANLYTGICGLGSSCVTPSAPLPVQPWFEAALGGATSAYCSGFASCTAAVASKQAANIRTTAVYNLWAALSAANNPSWTLGRTYAFSPICTNTVVPSIGSTAVPVCSQYRSVFMNAS